MTRLHEHLAFSFHATKVLILGFGREGKSSYIALRQALPHQELWVADQHEVDLDEYHDPLLHWQPGYLESVEKFDVIFRTPSIPYFIPQLQSALNAGKKVTSQLNEFLTVYRTQTIGVTGTKGKSTTSALIHHVLKTAGKESILAGNIGVPVFEIAKDIKETSLAVIEMSSYQLESVQYSPATALFISFFPEHLNHHKTLDAYLAAKFNIARFQKAGDHFFINESIQLLPQHGHGDVISYTASASQLRASGLDPSSYQHFPKVMCENAVWPVVQVAQLFQIDLHTIELGLRTFTQLPHRLEKVAEKNGVTFIDDTLATIPEASIAALDSLPRVDVMILGGFDRGISYQKIVDAIVAHHIPVVLFFLPTGQKMLDILHTAYPESTWPQTAIVTSMEDAVKKAYQYTPQGGVVLLSPASPSFGQFIDYEDKSRQYRHWIYRLAEKSDT